MFFVCVFANSCVFLPNTGASRCGAENFISSDCLNDDYDGDSINNDADDEMKPSLDATNTHKFMSK